MCTDGGRASLREALMLSCPMLRLRLRMLARGSASKSIFWRFVVRACTKPVRPQGFQLLDKPQTCRLGGGDGSGSGSDSGGAGGGGSSGSSSCGSMSSSSSRRRSSSSNP